MIKFDMGTNHEFHFSIDLVHGMYFRITIEKRIPNNYNVLLKNSASGIIFESSEFEGFDTIAKSIKMTDKEIKDAIEIMRWIIYGE